jgi:hypothetical protein
MRRIALILVLGLLGNVAYSNAAPFGGSSDDPPYDTECDITEDTVDEAVNAFQALVKDCLNKASTLEAAKACGDVE